VRPAATLLALLFAASPVVAQPGGAGASAKPRVLVLLLDCLPMETARWAWKDPATVALFPGFKGPTPMISSFPSETGVAVSGMLRDFGADAPPGYELRFFDRSRNKLRGGGLISYHTYHYGYREHFDFRINGLVQKALSYGFPERYNLWEIDAALATFSASDKPVWMAHLTSTDASAHMKRPRDLAELITYAGEKISALRDATDEPFYTVILSDHGVLSGETRPTNLKSPLLAYLGAQGWSVGRRIAGEDDVVLVGSGLVNVLVAYTYDGRESAFANVALGVDGVELCTWTASDEWRVASRAGVARIRRRPSTGGRPASYSYQPVTGDPLGYLSLVRRLRREHDDPRRLWFDDDDWLKVSRKARLPDALHRIREAFVSVENPASVLCSLDREHFYGMRAGPLLQRLWFGPYFQTHGSLHLESAEGFLLTDHPDFRPGGSKRFDDALDFLLDAGPARR
jgi:hypothetical protein